MKHELKVSSEFWPALMSGEKNFEIRFDDRCFQKGDIVHLRNWKQGYYIEPYKPIVIEITYVCHYEQKPGWCVFGFKVLEKPEEAGR